MNSIVLVSLTALWVVVLVNLALTLRLLRWLLAQKETRLRFLRGGEPLLAGQRAPAFRARTITGRAVTLDDYAGQRVAFVFSSPLCARCRRELPDLLALAPRAREHTDTTIVLVSDADVGTTQIWVRTIRDEDGIEVSLPVLAAPTNESTFTTEYNPFGAVPFFCVVEPDGTVGASGLVGQDEWALVTRAWQGRTQLASWMAHRH
jgi:AhpC/TSA family protein